MTSIFGNFRVKYYTHCKGFQIIFDFLKIFIKPIFYLVVNFKINFQDLFVGSKVYIYKQMNYFFKF